MFGLLGSVGGGGGVMSRLPIDDLVAAQQATEKRLEEIARLLRKKEPSAVRELINGVVGFLAIFAFIAGAFMAAKMSLLGVCICMAAIATRIEIMLSK